MQSRSKKSIARSLSPVIHENAVGRHALEEWEAIIPQKPLLAFDFDGTLAPIVPIPNGAFPRPRTLKLLTKLQKNLDIVIITGRSLHNLHQQLRTSKKAPETFRADYLIGNHGMEMPWDSHSRSLLKRARIWTRVWQKQIEEILPKFPEISFIEFKDVSLTLHIHRGVRNKASEKLKSWLQTNLIRDPKKIPGGKDVPRPKLRLLGGKHVLNVLPLDKEIPKLNKGVALQMLMEEKHYPLAIFVGDDVTDEDVFMVKPKRGMKILGIRIGVTHNTRARFFLREQVDIDTWLEELTRIAIPSRGESKNRRRPSPRRADKSKARRA